MKMWGWLLLLLVAGCDDGASSGASDGALDLGETPDQGRPDANGDQGVLDAEAVPDAQAADALPDSALIRELESCEDICAVYERCGALESTFGDLAQCQDRCTAAEDAERFPGYRACMQLASCRELDDCNLPAPPLPTCAEVCAARAACESEESFPARLGASCEVACNDAALVSSLQSCGQLLTQGGCDVLAFDFCVLNEVEPDCASVCFNQARCGLTASPSGCVDECVAGETLTDPLAQARATQRRQCRLRAGEDCEALSGCEPTEPPESPIVGTATVAELCAANQACPFFPTEGCEAAAEASLRTLAPNAIDCLVEALTDHCGEPIAHCFERAPVERACEAHCQAQSLCGRLPEGQSEFDCFEACTVVMDGDDRASQALLRAPFACATEDSCPALEACLTALSPAAQCEPICAAQLACEVEDAGLCQDACQRTWDTRRQQQEAACLRAANGCEAQSTCRLPPSPPCDRLCDATASCGDDDPACTIRCDDRALADETWFSPTLACALSTDRCDVIGDCLAGDTERANACLAWCTQRTECVVQPSQTKDACLIDCADGFLGQEGVLFSAVESCLAEIDADAGCEALATCFEADFESACTPYCQAVTGACGLTPNEVTPPEGGFTDQASAQTACEVACRTHLNELAYQRALNCTLTAERRLEGCGAVVECNGIEVEPAPVACQTLCAAQNVCSVDVDAFLCERACLPGEFPTGARAACASQASCDELDRCLDGPMRVPEDCSVACLYLEDCRGLDGGAGLFPDELACLSQCAGTAVLSASTYPARVADCVEAAACQAEPAMACFARYNSRCPEVFDALTACQMATESEEATIASCETEMTEEQRLCIIDGAAQAGGDAFACWLTVPLCFFGDFTPELGAP